jgi:TPR repeat protein
MSNRKNIRRLFVLFAAVCLSVVVSAGCGKNAGQDNAGSRASDHGSKAEVSASVSPLERSTPQPGVEQQSAEELFRLAVKYDEEDDQEKAWDCFRKAAELEHPKAQLVLGVDCYSDRKYAEAVEWTRKSAAQENEYALKFLRRLVDEGVPGAEEALENIESGKE